MTPSVYDLPKPCTPKQADRVAAVQVDSHLWDPDFPSTPYCGVISVAPSRMSAMAAGPGVGCASAMGAAAEGAGVPRITGVGGGASGATGPALGTAIVAGRSSMLARASTCF